MFEGLTSLLSCCQGIQVGHSEFGAPQSRARVTLPHRHIGSGRRKFNYVAIDRVALALTNDTCVRHYLPRLQCQHNLYRDVAFNPTSIKLRLTPSLEPNAHLCESRDIKQRAPCNLLGSMSCPSESPSPPWEGCLDVHQTWNVPNSQASPASLS